MVAHKTVKSQNSVRFSAGAAFGPFVVGLLLDYGWAVVFIMLIAFLGIAILVGHQLNITFAAKILVSSQLLLVFYALKPHTPCILFSPMVYGPCGDDKHGAFCRVAGVGILWHFCAKILASSSTGR